MALSAGIQKVSIKHEAILNHLLENPTQSLREVAGSFGISQAWLSCIIHSDAFQAKLRERQDTVFHHTVVATIKDKAALVAHATLDKLAEQIPFINDAKQLTETADKILGRLGYGGSNASAGVTVNVNNNQLHVDRALLEEARERIGRSRQQVRELTTAESSPVDKAPSISYSTKSLPSSAEGLPLPGRVLMELI